jgi:ATP-dependent DNA helicase PIF1
MEIKEEKQEIINNINVDKLNEDQQKAFDLVLSGKSIFIGGAAGTGKTFLLSKIVRALTEKKEYIFYVTASTGIAATNLSKMLQFENCQGMTLHSWTGMGVHDRYKTIYEDTEIIKKNEAALDRWLNTKTLIIEEISMVSPFFFQRISDIAKKLKNSSLPFGGIQIIACGDWAQLEPVRKSDPMEYQSMNFCFETKGWKDIIQDNVIILNKIYRQKDDIFISILTEIRHGRLSESSRKLLESRLIHEKDWIVKENKPITLYPRVDQVQKENIERLLPLTGKEYSFKGNWIPRSINDKKRKILLKRMIEGHSFEMEPLKLKVGANVMLTINLSTQLGLVNGLQGVIQGFERMDESENNNKYDKYPRDKMEEFPVVKFENGIELTIVRFTWYEYHGDLAPHLKPSWDNKNFVGMGYSQLPLKLGFAMTIHKSQGMGFKSLALDLGYRVFASGQAYTGLSRCISLDGLTLIQFNPKAIICNEKVIEFYNKYSPVKFDQDNDLIETNSLSNSIVQSLDFLKKRQPSKEERDDSLLFIKRKKIQPRTEIILKDDTPF